MDKAREQKLESLLRQARAKVFEDDNMDKVIIWLKRNLQPYWNDRENISRMLRDEKMLRLWD